MVPIGAEGGQQGPVVVHLEIDVAQTLLREHVDEELDAAVLVDRVLELLVAGLRPLFTHPELDSRGICATSTAWLRPVVCSRF